MSAPCPGQGALTYNNFQEPQGTLEGSRVFLGTSPHCICSGRELALCGARVLAGTWCPVAEGVRQGETRVAGVRADLQWRLRPCRAIVLSFLATPLSSLSSSFYSSHLSLLLPDANNLTFLVRLTGSIELIFLGSCWLVLFTLYVVFPSAYSALFLGLISSSLDSGTKKSQVRLFGCWRCK